jgi:hypothetical protein
MDSDSIYIYDILVIYIYDMHNTVQKNFNMSIAPVRSRGGLLVLYKNQIRYSHNCLAYCMDCFSLSSRKKKYGMALPKLANTRLRLNVLEYLNMSGTTATWNTNKPAVMEAPTTSTL